MAASWSIIKKIKLVAKEIPLLMNQDQFRMPGISQVRQHLPSSVARPMSSKFCVFAFDP